MKLRHKMVLMIFALAELNSLAFAQQDDIEKPEFYQIDLIVFAQDERLRPETPPLPAILPDYSDSIELKPVPVQQTYIFGENNQASNQGYDINFMRIEHQKYRIQNVWDKLIANRNFRPIIYQSWTQQAYPFGKAPSVRIQAEEIIKDDLQQLDHNQYQFDNLNSYQNSDQDTLLPTPEIDGSATFSKGVYLHLNLDIFFAPKSFENSELPWSFSQKSDEVIGYHLVQQRRLQTDSLQYYDHQWFGAIAYIHKLIEPEEKETITEDQVSE
ncbi:MAG: CsiV family protein [bacterium]